MKRNQALKRYYDEVHAKRHQKIYKSYGIEKPLGYFVKSKVHCSCPMCSSKTRLMQGTFHRKGKNWKHSDIKKLESLIDGRRVVE